MTSIVKEIELAISRLPEDQLKEFRSWYEKFDSDDWDKQIENDSASGKLDFLANQALADHQAGRYKRL